MRGQVYTDDNEMVLRYRIDHDCLIKAIDGVRPRAQTTFLLNYFRLEPPGTSQSETKQKS